MNRVADRHAGTNTRLCTPFCSFQSFLLRLPLRCFLHRPFFVAFLVVFIHSVSLRNINLHSWYTVAIVQLFCNPAGFDDLVLQALELLRVLDSLLFGLMRRSQQREMRVDRRVIRRPFVWCRDSRYSDMSPRVGCIRLLWRSTTLSIYVNVGEQTLLTLTLAERTDAFFSTSSGSASSPSDVQTSYPPLFFTASLTSNNALPAPTSVGSMRALKGPFRSFFPIRSSLPFSSCVSLRLSDDDACGREKTAGTAERWARILAEVRDAEENLGRRFRTVEQASVTKNVPKRRHYLLRLL